MKIIITGATGAFGAAMTKHFAAAGHQVIGTGRTANPPAELLANAQYLQVDITQPFTLPEADVCIHAAALSDDKATPQELYLPNVIGTKNVVKAAAKCKKFIHISSSSVYLPQADLLTENHAGKQNNAQLSPYGKSKLESEEMLRKVFKGPSCFVLRPRAFYGPGDTQILPRMLKLVKNEKLNRPGKLNIQLSMTHYTNMAAAIECCLKSDKKGIHIYNVADGENYIMIDILRKLLHAIYRKKISEREIPIGLLKVLAFFKIGGFTPLLVRAITKNMALDITKIKTELGYNAPLTFDESLPDIADWIEKIGGADVLKNPPKSLIWKS